MEPANILQAINYGKNEVKASYYVSLPSLKAPHEESYVVKVESHECIPDDDETNVAVSHSLTADIFVLIHSDYITATTNSIFFSPGFCNTNKTSQLLPYKFQTS